MRRSIVALPFLASLASSVWAASPPLRGAAVDETLNGEAVLAEALNEARLRADGLPFFARIRFERGELEVGPGEYRFDRLDERVERYRFKGVPVLLALGGPLPAIADAEPWRRFVRALAEKYKGVVKAYELGETPAEGPAPAAPDFAFVLKLAAIQIRAADPDALIVQGSLQGKDLDWQERFYEEDVAPYLDAVAIAGEAPDLAAALPRLQALLEREDPTATIVVTGVALGQDPGAATRSLLDWQLSHLGGKVSLTTYTGGVPALAPALRALAQVKDVLTAEIVPLEDKAAGLKLLVGGEDRTAGLPHTLLYNLDNFSTYLVYGGAAGQGGPLAVELADPTGRTPFLRDAMAAKTEALRGFTWDRKLNVTHVGVPLADRPMLVDFRYGGDAAHTAQTEVSASVLPTVGEIVFRHQQAQAVQDALLRNYIANTRMESHFRPNATDSGFDVVTENRFYTDKEGSEWEETSFVLNGSRWGRKRPPFPLLQPEKVLSLPLDLRLSKDYRYRLEGVEKVGENECYALRFEPLTESQSLYRGTVWIDTRSFVKVKVQAVQTHLVPPVVSSEETQYFTPQATADGQQLNLLSRFTTRQIMLIAGRNLLVERVVRLSDFEVNASDFAQRRAAARSSDNIMFRDTDKGLRYFEKKGDQRVVQEHPATKAKALAVGVTVDPSFDYPLPILGINYLDFNFLGREDTQFALLFGGVLALANLQKPRAIGDKVDLSLDLFAIAVPINDRVFDSQGERPDERLKNHPFATGVNLGYQLSSFQKLRGAYQFRFDGYKRDSQTASGFQPPVNTITNGFGLGYDYSRGGYSLTLGGFFYRRGSWEPWGTSEDFSPDERSYWKYNASLSKDLFFKSVHKIHLNVAYFGGRRLDRFTKYQFGMFEDNKIRGVPSAGVRFGELGMVRGSYSFNLFEQYRLDLFVDQAFGRPDSTQKKWESITGLGLGLNVRAPFGTMLRGEIGKSFLPERYRGSGSFVGQVMVLKPL